MSKAILIGALLAGVGVATWLVMGRVDKQARQISTALAIAAATYKPLPFVTPYTIPTAPDVTYEQVVAKGETIPTNVPVVPKPESVWSDNPLKVFSGTSLMAL